jgi:hypothetical protein
MPKVFAYTIVPQSLPYDRVPLSLFRYEEYADLSLDAKLLYTRLLSLADYSSFKKRFDSIGLFITMNLKSTYQKKKHI